MNRPEIILIAAAAKNRVIGMNGEIPWRIPADQRRFKQITMGAPMIMGRKTFESLPGLLPGRRHIVLTRQAEWQEDGAETAANLEEALKIANAPHVWVIGGGEIYAMFLSLADRLELTEVDANPMGDALFPELGPEWREVSREIHASSNGAPSFDFVTLKREPC